MRADSLAVPGERRACRAWAATARRRRVADKKQVREPTYLHCGRVRYTTPGNEVDRTPKKSITRKVPSGVEGSQASWSGGEAGGGKRIGE